MITRYFNIYVLILINICRLINCDEILGCNGFVKSEIDINFSEVVIKLYTKQGSLKDQTECAPNNGYYFLPLYDNGEYILKVDPPKGWSFEPAHLALSFDGKTDFCSLGKDINFSFKGFAVTGKVISAGSDVKVGPAGVKVELTLSGNQLLEVHTDEVGSFLFTPVLPNTYTVKTSHPRWKMAKSEVTVHVGKGNSHIPHGSLVVTGYEVSGSVTSDNEPITGVTFILFSSSKNNHQNEAVTGCDPDKLQLLGFSTVGLQLNGASFMCHVNSDGSGKFLFPVVPSGQYIVVPHYKGAQNIKFDVHPSLVHVNVHHSSVHLTTPFQVKGFSVSGKVLWSKDGKPIDGAPIIINKKVVTKTGKDGLFHLESMRAGNYLLSVELDDVQFKESEVKVTPKTPVLPDLYPEAYKVCGSVKYSSQSSRIQVDPCTVLFSLKDSDVSHNVKVDATSGEYCLFLPRGLYIASVPVSSEEQKIKGLQFAPLQREVSVVDGPVRGIDFSQLRAVVRGQVKCLSKKPCPDITINLISKTGQEHMSTSVGKDGDYIVNNVLPGEYQVTLDRALEWCWDQEVAPLIVNAAETKGPTFVQTGISITFISSHETKVRYKLIKDGDRTDKQGGISGDLLVAKGNSKVCLSDLGEYEMEPIGCHGYIVPKYYWKGTPIVLTAISHAYTGHIVTRHHVTDIIIGMHSNDEKTQQPKEFIPLKGKLLQNGDTEYTFPIQLAEGEKVTLVPTASSVLFSPASADIIGGSDCTDGITFVAEKGKIFEGRVLRESSIPLSAAVVSLFDSEDNILDSFTTNSDGSYKFGPLNATKVYKLTAEKEGYVLSGPTDVGDFNAHKLAEVVVEVKDKADGSSLQGVLLSLSGGESYRRNSATGTDGKMAFLSLSPNDYYLRPMMKEYRFDPPSKMLTVKEGATVNVVLFGNRVAYSVFGSVTALSGDAEAGVVVEAIGVGGEHPDCSQRQEESISETNGVFRIRGLQPQCEYSVRMKEGAGVNEHIRRSTPDGIFVKVNNEDVQNIRLIAFRHITQTDLTVYISADSPEHLRSLKAKLYREEVPVHSIKLSDLKATPTFALTSIVVTFPALVTDGRSYSLQLESSLSQSTHAYVTHPVQFKANSSFRLIRLNFFPQPRSTDSELSHSSYIVIPLFLLAIIMYYHKSAVLEYANYFMQLQQSRAAVNTKTHTVDDLATDTLIVEPVKRKLKPRKA